MRPMKFGIGQPAPRVEDPAARHGARAATRTTSGRPGALHAVVLRTPARACPLHDRRPRRDRAAMPGVRLVLTARRPRRLRRRCPATRRPRTATARRCTTAALSAPGGRASRAMSATRSPSSSPRPTAQARDAAEALPDRLGAAAGGRRDRGRGGVGRAARLGRGRRQPRLRLRVGDAAATDAAFAKAARTVVARRSSTTGSSRTTWSRAPASREYDAGTRALDPDARQPGRARHPGHAGEARS